MAGHSLGHMEGKPVGGLRAGNPAVMMPDGAFNMRMADWAPFATDQLLGEKGQGKLLKADTYRFLHAAQGKTVSALGWGIKRDFPANAPKRLLMHLGSNGFWHALIVLAPDSMDGVLIAANAGEGTSAQAKQVALGMAMVNGFGGN